MATEECVVGVYSSMPLAESAVRAVANAGLPRDRISLVASGSGRNPEVREAIQQGDKTVTSSIAGAGAGGLLGLLIGGATILAVPGLGPIFAAGAIATGLTGAIVGGVLGCMAGWGVPENHIRLYEEKVRDGRVLVIYHGDPQYVADAERVIQETDVEEVHLHAADADESPEVDDAPSRIV